MGMTQLQIAKHILYAFRDTHWDWNNLTSHEKEIYPDQDAVNAARAWARWHMRYGPEGDGLSRETNITTNKGV